MDSVPGVDHGFELDDHQRTPRVLPDAAEGDVLWDRTVPASD